MTIAEMNKADMQVINLVNAANDRRCEEKMRRAENKRKIDLLQAAQDREDQARENQAREAAQRKRRILIASGSVLCFLASIASVAAMELGRLTPTVGIVFMVVPALVAARMMIRDAGR